MSGRKRRGNGEGTIYERSDGRWEGKIVLANGKRHSAYGKTRQEVVAKLRQLASDQDRGLPVGLNQRLTLGAFLTDWCERHGSGKRPRTRRRYRELLALHIIPQLGRVPLVKLTPLAIERRLQELYTQPIQRGNKPLSAATVNRVRSALHVALEDAVYKGVLARNPCDQAKAPREERHEPHVYTEAQCFAFLDAIVGDRLEALYLLALTTGLRNGELLGLTWETADLAAGTVRVSHIRTIDEENQPTVALPKTDSSRRTLRLLPEVVDALRAHRTRQIEERLATGAAYHDDNLVFARPDGRPIDGRSFNRVYLYPLQRRHGLPRVKLHELRHSFATLQLHEGTPLAEVSRFLGHASQRTTLTMYSHALPGSDAVVTTTARILSRRKHRDV